MSIRAPFFAAAFLVSAAMFAQEPKSYSVGATSVYYSIDVDIQTLPNGERQYDARVTERATKRVVAEKRFVLLQKREESRSENDGVTFTIRILPGALSLGVDLTAEKDGSVIDAIHASFNTGRAISAAGAVRVGGDVKAPIVIKRVEPVYPEAAKRDRVAGIVILELVIDKSGFVRDAVVLKELPNGLSEAALDAVRQWQFQPATLNGNPVDVIFNITMNFRLDSPKEDS